MNRIEKLNETINNNEIKKIERLIEILKIENCEEFKKKMTTLKERRDLLEMITEEQLGESQLNSFILEEENESNSLN